MQHVKQQGRVVDRSPHARQAVGCSFTVHVRNVADHVAVWLGHSVFIAGFGLLVLIEIGGVVDVGIAFLCSPIRLLCQLAI